VDVVLVAFNFGQDPAFYQKFTGSFDFVARQPELPRVLAKARAAGIGVVAMKTLRGGRLNDMRPYEGAGATFAQAAFRWILSTGLADALVVTMKSPAQVDEYLGASGWTAPHPADAGLLRRYARRSERTQCRYGCGDCASACPAGVSIADVLRARMYAFDYAEPSLARAALAEAGGAAACLACDGTPCASACPHGVAIPELTKQIAATRM
jgi:predicted aldo/keto reductase-like oxidoreductase